MSSTTRRRDLYVSLKLIVCIALGIWLGAMAVFSDRPAVLQKPAPG
ncbi:hypothetical protein Pgy4_09973, partial [Pseudomonas savastanoi pv. glycinea str. race 4]